MSSYSLYLYPWLSIALLFYCPLSCSAAFCILCLFYCFSTWCGRLMMHVCVCSKVCLNVCLLYVSCVREMGLSVSIFPYTHVSMDASWTPRHDGSKTRVISEGSLQVDTFELEVGVFGYRVSHWAQDSPSVGVSALQPQDKMAVSVTCCDSHSAMAADKRPRILMVLSSESCWEWRLFFSVSLSFIFLDQPHLSHWSITILSQ